MHGNWYGIWMFETKGHIEIVLPWVYPMQPFSHTARIINVHPIFFVLRASDEMQALLPAWHTPHLPPFLLSSWSHPIGAQREYVRGEAICGVCMAYGAHMGHNEKSKNAVIFLAPFFSTLGPESDWEGGNECKGISVLYVIQPSRGTQRRAPVRDMALRGLRRAVDHGVGFALFLRVYRMTWCVSWPLGFGFSHINQT